jgi:hypothetical protein
MTDVDLSNIAAQAANAYAQRNDDLAFDLYAQASTQASEHKASVAFINAFAQLAGRARRGREHSLVCRLQHGVNFFKTDTVTRKELRQIWVSHGAAGYLPRLPEDSPRPRYLLLGFFNGLLLGWGGFLEFYLQSPGALRLPSSLYFQNFVILML